MPIGEVLFHTVENRNNLSEVQRSAPFKCTREQAWLGNGYYFWEGSEKLAHWWGNSNYHERGYIICTSKYTAPDDTVYDLVGNINLLNEFSRIYEEIKKKRNVKK